MNLKQISEYNRHIGKPLKQGTPQEMLKCKKHAARKLVARYVRLGKMLRKPCEYADCDSHEVEAHHHDYDEPLSVLWLCRKHHLELHRHL